MQIALLSRAIFYAIYAIFSCHILIDERIAIFGMIIE